MGFSRKVSRGVFGGPADEYCFVTIRWVPMRWLNSVGVIQNFIRKFVFWTCTSSPHMEAGRAKATPKGDLAVVCMDGVDVITRLRIARDTIKGVPSP